MVRSPGMDVPWGRAVAVTGSRYGITSLQRARLLDFLADSMPRVLHHGDCLGADAEAQCIAVALGIQCMAHPGTSDEWRAGTTGNHTVYLPRPNLERNEIMVRTCDYLIALPREYTEQARGGTWYTIRYAREKGKTVYEIFPDGEMIEG